MIRKNAGGVLLATLLLSFAFFSLNAFAAQDTLVGGEVNVVAGVEPVLRISLPSDITIKIDPGSKDPYTVPVKLNIYTNNPDGYFSSISTNKNRANAEDTSATALAHKEDNRFKIDPLAATTTFEEFPAGYWGYSVDGGKTFNSVPAANETPAETNTDAGLYFGVKVPESQASGMYSNTIVVAAVTRHVLSQDELFDGIQYMQDMTQQICETENAGMAKQLTDRRDGKRYWVTKMRDNSCWMTQNLDLEISSEGTTLTPSDSNVFATKTIYKEDARGGNDIFYMDGGDYYVPNGDNYDDNGNPTSTAELASDSLDWHYHVGSIYSWPAATAGSGTNDILSGEADESICPKGWRLPIRVSYVARDRGYTFYRLFKSQPETLTSSVSGSGIVFTIDDIGMAPFYFIDARNLYQDVNYDVMPFLPEREYVGSYEALKRSTSYIFSLWTSTVLPAELNYYNSTHFGSEYDNNINDNKYALPYLGYYSNSGYYDNGVGNRPVFGTANSYDHNLQYYRYNGSFVRCVSSKNDLYSISTMQEITPEIIKNTDVESAKRLVDERDGKKYWVTKEYDGNIWMTQNLDFEISTSGTNLTPDDSDVLSAKTLTAAADFGADPDGIYYFDEGNNYYYSGSVSYGFYDINNNAGHTLEEYDGKQSMRGHGHVGDFYSWNAATAGSGSLAEVGSNATESICPKGWHLPTNGGAEEVSDGSYDKMVSAFVAKDTRKEQNNYYEQYYYRSTDPISNPPLYYHYTGYIDESGALSGEGNTAVYWSSRLKNLDQSGNAYAYWFKVSNNSPSGYSPSDSNMQKASYGAKVRCIANNMKQFAINYNANGGMNAPSSQYGASTSSSYTFTLSDNIPIRAGLRFTGWATSPDAVTAEYQPGDSATFMHGTINLYAIWSPKLIISFDANGGTGMMEDQIIESGTAKILRRNTYRRPGGYRFLGWSIYRNATSAEYANGGMYTVPTITHDTNVTLYAIWEYLGQEVMQEYDCSQLGDGQETILLDVRDNKTYHVAKLTDGKCWMTENLQLDFANLREAISSENTNNPESGFVAFANSRPASSNTWCDYWGQSCVEEYVYNTNNLNNQSSAKYGVYYNWHTATAGNGTYNTNDYMVSVTGDICPKGWHLPTGGYDGEYRQLTNPIYNSTGSDGTTSEILRNSPYNFTYTGYFYNTSTDYVNNGYYWTSTANYQESAYYLNIYDGGGCFGTCSYSKYYGMAVRCLAN